MSSQTTLTEDAPMILDATCSFAWVWPNAYAAIRGDVRREVNPDIVLDAKHLPFREGCFDKVYLDPPHTFGSSIYVHDKMERYGHFKNRREWHEFAEAAQPEAIRVCKPNGLIFWKITETADSRLKVAHIPTEGSQLIAHRITKSKSNRTGKHNVHWLTMKPTIREEAKAG